MGIGAPVGPRSCEKLPARSKCGRHGGVIIDQSCRDLAGKGERDGIFVAGPGYPGKKWMTGDHKSVTVTVVAGIRTGLPCQ